MMSLSYQNRNSDIEASLLVDQRTAVSFCEKVHLASLAAPNLSAIPTS